MAANIIYDLENIEGSKFTFSPVKTLDNGGRLVYIYHAKKPLTFATSEMFAPFGLNEYENTKKFSVNLSFSDNEELLAKIKEIEDAIIDEATKESMVWFKKDKPMSREVVKEFFSSNIKYPKDPKYMPTVKVGVPYKNGSFETQAYNAAKEKIELSFDALPRESKVEAIIQCPCIWLSGGKVSAPLKALQLKIKPGKGPVTYDFVKDDDDVNNAEEEN